MSTSDTGQSGVLHNHAPNTATTSCPACVGGKAGERARLFPKDTWSFDVYLAGVIAEGLGQIAERGLGCPGSLAPQGTDVDEGIEKWRAILAEMALGFKLYHAAEGADEFGQRTPELDRSFELLREWWEHLWD